MRHQVHVAIPGMGWRFIANGHWLNVDTLSKPLHHVSAKKAALERLQGFAITAGALSEQDQTFS